MEQIKERSELCGQGYWGMLQNKEKDVYMYRWREMLYESGKRVAKECQEFATWVLHEGLLASSLRFKYTEVGKWYGKRKSLGLGPYR